MLVIICGYKTVIFWFQLAGVKNEVVLQAFGPHQRRVGAARGGCQHALGHLAEVSKPTIYRLETARYSVTLDVLASLAQELEIPLSELMQFPVPPPPAD
jgi:DNA-binding XRE family transcriptional regulator